MRAIVIRRILCLSCLLVLVAGCDMFVSPAARLERAADFRAQGDMRAASIELKKILQDEPENTAARLMLAQTALALGDPDGALEYARRAARNGADAAIVAAVEVGALHDLGRDEEALTSLEKNRSLLRDPELARLEGSVLLGLNRLDAAEKAFQRGLSTDSGSLDAQVGLGEIASLRGNREAAAAAFDRALKQHPKAGPVWFAQGRAQMREGRFADASKSFDTALASREPALNPLQELVARLARFDARLALGDTAAASVALEDLRKNAPNAYAVSMADARLAFATHDYVKATTVLQKIVTRQPQAATPRFLLGAAHLAAGNLEQAEFHLARAVADAPENLQARKLLAQTRLRQSRADDAIDALAPALRSDVVDPQVEMLLDAAVRRSGKPSMATEMLEKRVVDSPDSVDAKLDLAAAYISSGQAARGLEVLRGMPEVTSTRQAGMVVSALASERGPAEARAELERMVSAHPRDVGFLNLAAAFYSARNDFPAASRMLTRALEVDPRSLASMLMLAELQLARGDVAAASGLLDRAAVQAPDNDLVKSSRASVAWAQGRKGDARRLLEEVHARNPKAIGPGVALARICFLERDFKRGQEIIDSMVAAAPRSAETRTAAGSLLLDFGRSEAAVAHLREAAGLDPGSAPRWLSLARAQIAQEQWADARASVTRALSNDADSIPAASLSALLDLREGKKDEALRSAMALRARFPNNAAVAALEGDVRARLGQSAEAAAAYAQSAQLQPSLAVVMREVESRRQARIADAEAPLVKWVANRPEDKAARTILAETYRTSGRSGQALAEYERLAATNASPAALNNLAWMYYEAGDERAEAMARRAHTSAPDNPMIADTLGWILTERGQLDEGERILKAASDAAPANPTIRFHYAAVLAKARKIEEARRQIQSALDHAGSFPERPAAERLKAELFR